MPSVILAIACPLSPPHQRCDPPCEFEPSLFLPYYFRVSISLSSPISLLNEPWPPLAPNKLSLKSSDGKILEVEEAVAMESLLIKGMVEGGCASPLPLPHVRAEILTKVIEFLKRRAEVAARSVEWDKNAEDFSSPELREWMNNLIYAVDLNTFSEFTRASCDLGIRSLLYVICDIVVRKLKRSPRSNQRNLEH